jgi:hypothetical protein
MTKFYITKLKILKGVSDSEGKPKTKSHGILSLEKDSNLNRDFYYLVMRSTMGIPLFTGIIN